MRLNTFIRLSGLATIVGGIGFTLFEILADTLHPESLPFSQRYIGIQLSTMELVQFVSLMILLFGFVGLYLHQMQRAGKFGLIGFLALFVGTAFITGEVWASTFLFSALSAQAPQFLDSLTKTPPAFTGAGVFAGLVLFPLGLILFSISSLMAKVYPRWACIALIVGILLFPFLPIAGSIILGAGLAWMGHQVWRNSSADFRIED